MTFPFQRNGTFVGERMALHFFIAKEDRWTNFDPRLTLESLRKRGVKVDDFILR